MTAQEGHMQEVNNSNDSFVYMLLEKAIKLPGVKINRETYLRGELNKHFNQEVVEIAVVRNPAAAGITIEQIEKIAKSTINHEATQVTLISTAAGIPGGLAMIGAVPGDIIQYFAHLLRVLQKLVYLYGWEELYNLEGEFDDETKSRLILFVGVMFGVKAANAAVVKIAQQAAIKVEKDLVNRALTKGMIYPVVKKVVEQLGYKLTKETFAKSISKVVPVLGGVVSGGVTYVSFLPAAYNLKRHLKMLPIADASFYKQDNHIIEAE